MTTGQNELTVTIAGRDLSLQKVLAKVEDAMHQNADQAVKLGQAYARLAVAQKQPAAASAILAGTMQQAGNASERALLSLQTQAARTNTGLQALPRTLDGLSGAAASFATGFVGVGTALTLAKSAVDSFADAFTFKADLDATTLSVNAQIKGIRESGQVWSEAAKFADTYKLTQQETTEAIQASIGVMRTSKSSVEDVLGVLSRLQVLSPEQSLQEAALAVKALASGDITSLVGRFEVSRDVANQMKQEILSGADAVQVLSQFLGDSGVGMDVLKSKTEGASGAMKDLAKAQEDLKLAQAGWAQGPGLTVLHAQTSALQLLSGEMSGSTKSTAAFTAGLFQNYGALSRLLSVFATAIPALGGYSSGQQQAAGATIASANAATQETLETNRLANAQTAVQGALSASAQALVDETTKKLDSAQAAQQLSQFQETLANLGGAVAGGMQTAGSAAAAMASQYNIAYGAALNLINAQAALAQAKVNAAALVEQRFGERNPGASGVAEAAAMEQARLEAIYKRLVIPPIKPPKGGGGGGGGGGGLPPLSDQTKLQNQLLASQEQYQDKSADAEAAYLDDVLKINRDFQEKMLSAQKDFDQERMESSASFYDQQGTIESDAIRQAASQQYEAASIEAEKIAQEKGADVANKYMDAQEKIISDRARRQEDIEKALNKKDKEEFDPDKAKYLQGVDALYRKAEDAKLARIKEGEGSLATERDKQLEDSAAKEAEALEKIGTASDRATERKILGSQRSGKIIDEEKLKVDGLTTSYNNLGAAGSRAGITPVAGTPAPTSTTTPPGTAAAPQAGEQSSMLSALDAIRAAVDAAASKIVAGEQSTTSAVRGLQGKFAS
jgi:hypothetical protein